MDSEPRYRNSLRVFSTCQFGKGTYWYVPSTDRYRKGITVQTGTYQYVLVFTKIHQQTVTVTASWPAGGVLLYVAAADIMGDGT